MIEKFLTNDNHLKLAGSSKLESDGLESCCQQHQEASGEKTPPASRKADSEPEVIKTPEQSEPEPTGNETKPMMDGIETIRNELEKLSEVISKRLPALSGLDELHKQHARLLDGFWQQQVELLYRSLIPVIDRLEDRCIYIRKTLKEHATDSSLRKTAALLMGARIELMTVLAARGIEEFRTTGSDFSAEKHQPVKLVPTTDRRRDGKIARRLRAGYKHNSRVLRYEQVEIYKYDNNSF